MLKRDVLFIIKAPFEDNGAMWFCSACAMMEGALLANPHWGNRIDVRRMPYPRPRRDVIALIGEEHQEMPVLVLAKDSTPPEGASEHEGRFFITDAKAITRYLAATYRGAGPHP